ncbi:MAG TPA: hypothetical protein DEB06_08980 [Phycisphaerales bacterium]|nr:hypothetical protein [Phycisphaerales bacterium]
MTTRLPNPTWRERLPLWFIDGLLIGLFMVSVGVFVPLFASPQSPVARAIESDLLRRGLIGITMGLTAIALIRSPFGARSGALMNPAVTLSFLRLGRIRPLDAGGYIACQFAGALLGCLLIGALVGPPFTDDPVRSAPTVPGIWGVAGALAGEALIAFVMMTTVLFVSNTARLARFTAFFAGGLVALYITLEAPLSGMGLNPARSLASAVPAGELGSVWVYFVAPVTGMLLAAELFARVRALPAVHCCKLNHDHPGCCIHCGCDGPIDFSSHADDPR